MKSPQQLELENMALAAELARQLCHDFSNFIYNLFLQIEIGASSRSPATPNEWESLKREGKNIVRLMQEWEQFQSQSFSEETKVDLHQVVRQLAEGASSEKSVVVLAPSILAGPLFVTASAIDSAHLLRLQLEDAFHQPEDHDLQTVRLETETINGKATVRFLFQPPPEEVSAHDEPRHTSLIAATCRSLALRLDANISREDHPDGSRVIRVEFP